MIAGIMNATKTTKHDRLCKIYTFTIILFLALFHILNFAIWNTSTKLLLDSFSADYVGDLARLAYIPEITSMHTESYDLPVAIRDIAIADLSKITAEVVTIGDSFSFPKARHNYMYQAHLAATSKLRVLNAQFHGDLLTLVQILLDTGILKSVSAKYLILECVERMCLSRFAIPWPALENAANALSSSLIGFQYLQAADSPPRANQQAPYPGIGLHDFRYISKGNFKYLLYRILYRFDDRAFISMVYNKQLSKACFSTGDGKRLLVHFGDPHAASCVDDNSMRILNENLNHLSSLLRNHNIRLIFMPIVDKYTLYRPYIVNNDLVRPSFFERLENMEKEYEVINTQASLRDAVENDVLDIYHVDDTHWNCKAPQILFGENGAALSIFNR